MIFLYRKHEARWKVPTTMFADATQQQILLGIFGAVLTALFLGGFYLTRLRTSQMWTIVVTPLASIIGSGFLVVAPLLYSNFGSAALPAIIFISLFALGVGLVIRTNIKYFEPLLENEHGGRLVLLIERLSNVALGISYVISVAFYIVLLSSFTLELFGLRETLMVRLLTTAILAFIGLFGFLRGLHGLESLEKVAVNVKLSIIGALVLVMASANLLFMQDGISAPAGEATLLSVHGLQILGGMLLITQGFETARYLGHDYSRKDRARALLIAQLLATVIYILFVALAQPFSGAITEVTETAIIALVGAVAVGLPVVLSLAAIFSQFGAGVADTIGTGGILEEESRGKIQRRKGYLIIAVLAILLIWVMDIFQVLTLASRAFALYYGLQAIIATIVTWRYPQPSSWRRAIKLTLFPTLAILLFLIAIFAIPAH